MQDITLLGRQRKIATLKTLNLKQGIIFKHKDDYEHAQAIKIINPLNLSDMIDKLSPSSHVYQETFTREDCKNFAKSGCCLIGTGLIPSPYKVNLVLDFDVRVCSLKFNFNNQSCSPLQKQLAPDGVVFNEMSFWKVDSPQTVLKTEFTANQYGIIFSDETTTFTSQAITYNLPRSIAYLVKQGTVITPHRLGLTFQNCINFEILSLLEIKDCSKWMGNITINTPWIESLDQEKVKLLVQALSLDDSMIHNAKLVQELFPPPKSGQVGGPNDNSISPNDDFITFNDISNASSIPNHQEVVSTTSHVRAAKHSTTNKEQLRLMGIVANRNIDKANKVKAQFHTAIKVLTQAHHIFADFVTYKNDLTTNAQAVDTFFDNVHAHEVVLQDFLDRTLTDDDDDGVKDKMVVDFLQQEHE